MYLIDKITTKRLIITAMTLKEMEQLITSTADSVLNDAYRSMHQGMLEHPDQLLWYTNWNICLKESGLSIGGACFKGSPSLNHEVEIGYGIAEKYQNQDFMSEAVNELCAWAFRHADCFYVQAQTEPLNASSQKVLEKNHFLRVGVGEEGLLYELEKPKFTWLPIYILLGLAGGLYLGIAFERIGYGLAIGFVSGMVFAITLNRADQKARIKNSKKSD